MGDNGKAYQLGDRVFVADATPYHREEVTCPICFGKRYITAILGDDSTVDVDCEACGKGYESPRGTVHQSVAKGFVTAGTITGVYERFGKVQFDVNGCSRSAENIFSTQEAAEARRDVLLVEAEKQAEWSFEQQFKRPRDLAWTIRYHRECIANLERSLDWHRSKLATREERAAKKKKN